MRCTHWPESRRRAVVVVARVPLTARLALVAVAVVSSQFVHAQVVKEDGRTYYVQSSVTFQQTLTDNGRLQGDNGRAELITEIQPRIRLGAQTRWVRGSIDYALRGIVYARDSDRNDVEQSLSLGTGASGAGQFELIENRLFVDARGDIGQSIVSPFGQTTGSRQRQNDNMAQVGSYTLAPYLVGDLGTVATYRLGASHSARTEPDSFSVGATSTSTQLNVASGRDFGRFGWGLAAGRTTTDYDQGRRTDVANALATVSYAVALDLVLFANAGSDWNNYRSSVEQRYDRYGVGFQWRPTERTQVSAQVDDRFFGTGYSVVAQHRTPRTIWTLSSNRDSSDFLGQGVGVLGTVYDLLYAQFASIQPDPLLREQLVLDYLRRNGIPPQTLLVSDFLSSSATLQQRHELAFALIGRRSTLTISATHTRTSRLDTVVSAVDVFNDSRYVRQRGLSVTTSHRLTPLASLSLRLAEVRTTGELDTQSARQRTAELAWVTSLGPRTDFALTARRAEFDSVADPYVENSLIGTLSIRFF